jgi:hypothetical protein
LAATQHLDLAGVGVGDGFVGAGLGDFGHVRGRGGGGLGRGGGGSGLGRLLRRLRQDHGRHRLLDSRDRISLGVSLSRVVGDLVSHILNSLSDGVIGRVCNNVIRSVGNNLFRSVCDNIIRSICNDIIRSVCNDIIRSVGNDIIRSVGNNLFRSVCDNVICGIGNFRDGIVVGLGDFRRRVVRDFGDTFVGILHNLGHFIRLHGVHRVVLRVRVGDFRSLNLGFLSHFLRFRVGHGRVGVVYCDLFIRFHGLILRDLGGLFDLRRWGRFNRDRVGRGIVCGIEIVLCVFDGGLRVRRLRLLLSDGSRGLLECR